MDGWLELEHSVTGGRTSIPDSPDVLAMHEARGWKVADAPAEDAETAPPKRRKQTPDSGTAGDGAHEKE